jgi:hypothetical protein
MEPKPAKRCRVPAYPTKLEILDTPDLLLKNQPLAWINRKELTAACGILVAVGSLACNDTRRAAVAPVFRHGEGRANFGGSPGPPAYVFLNEQEAFSIIREELAREGIRFDQNDVLVRGVQISDRRRKYLEPCFYRKKGKEIVVEVPNTGKPYSADMKDSTNNVVVEYVSLDENRDLGGVRDAGTGSRNDLSDTAAYVCERVRRQAKDSIYYGAFYDPAVLLNRKAADTSEDPWQVSPEVNRKALQESKQLLRAQVKDFADWLKAQGVI